MATTIPITTRGAEKLKTELHRLKTVDRPGVIQAIAEARAQGDLSENAEYEAAKDRQGFIEGRIRDLEGKLAAAQVIDPSSLDAGGRVVFGATVELEEETSGEVVKYQIVGEDEADLKQGLINVSSPIARALIGKEEGDTAEVQAPGGTKRYEIVAVHYATRSSPSTTLDGMAHPRSACGASPSRGRHQRPGKAGSAVALEGRGSV
jgi:transcription elongation factor GreA